MVFAVHDVEWTPERIRRFWDHYETDDLYFAKMVGRALLSRVGLPVGTAVDIGCGHGDLLEFLIERGWKAYGVEQSPASVRFVTKRFRDQPRFKGFIVPDGSADAVFLLEVVEHVDDSTLGGLLSEARRMLRPGGHLVITTPNAENLSLSRVICPDCGARFHRVQHVRSWSAGALTDHLARLGYAGFAKATFLTDKAGWKAIAQRAFHRIKSNRPHLVYVGTKQQPP